MAADQAPRNRSTVAPTFWSESGKRLRNRIDDEGKEEWERKENEGKQETRRTKRKRGYNKRGSSDGVGKEKEEELAAGQNPEGVAKAASQKERKKERKKEREEI